MSRGGDGGVVVDVRALQAHDHASRGIGRYSLDLIQAIEHADPDLVRAFVVDPDFPMHEQAMRLLGTGKLCRSDASELAARPPSVFHITNPFVEGQRPTTMLPRWARGVGTSVVATVYNLIPVRFTEVYLSDPNVAAEYAGRAQLLRTCDRLLSISDATSSDLTELLGVAPSRVVTVYGAAGPEFSPPDVPRSTLVRSLAGVLPDVLPAERIASGYLLCPSGTEWRKNLDRLLQAWALVDPVLRTDHPLVVQCHPDPEARRTLVARAAELGVGDDVCFTDRVPDHVLIDLMRAASLVVFPSTYEGLGLPILEARACGAPVISGDNSSLHEVVEDPVARFDAEDVADIARVVQHHLVDPAARAALAAAPVPDRYRWSEVARVVCDSYRDLLARPVRTHSRQPRLAIASPVPPQMSGPSAYLAEFVRHLPDLCDLTVFATVATADVQLPRGVRVEPLEALELIEAVEGPFDEVLYFIGNSEFHMLEERQLRRRSGAVFLHDARLTTMYSQMYRLHPDLMGETFGDALHRMYPGRYPPPMGGAQFLPLSEEGTFGVLMIADVARLATRLFVHSDHAADLVELDCGRRPEVLFPIPSPVLDESRVLGRLDDHRGRALVSTFGLMSPAKRSDDLIGAMALVPDADLALVGYVHAQFHAELSEQAALLGTSGRVTVTGNVSDAVYRDWLLRTTVAVQLRMFSNGESSASVAETLAAGIPTVVTDIGTFSEYPDDVVVKVPRDISTNGLGAVLRDLVSDVDRRDALSLAGRGYAEQNSYRVAAEKLVSELLRPGS